jgi:hypothetical protein
LNLEIFKLDEKLIFRYNPYILLDKRRKNMTVLKPMWEDNQADNDKKTRLKGEQFDGSENGLKVYWYSPEKAQIGGEATLILKNGEEIKFTERRSLGKKRPYPDAVKVGIYSRNDIDSIIGKFSTEEAKKPNVELSPEEVSAIKACAAKLASGRQTGIRYDTIDHVPSGKYERTE